MKLTQLNMEWKTCQLQISLAAIWSGEKSCFCRVKLSLAFSSLKLLKLSQGEPHVTFTFIITLFWTQSNLSAIATFVTCGKGAPGVIARQGCDVKAVFGGKGETL